jgi:hypothetical protein
VSHGYNHSLSFAEIETRINEGPQYFARVSQRNIENFACRKIDRPKDINEICEYARFVALTCSAFGPRELKNRLVSEIKSAYDIIKIYSLARDIQDDQLYTEARDNYLTSARSAIAWNDLADFFNVNEEGTRWAKGVLVPQDHAFGFYYTYRYTGAAGDISCAHVTISGPSESNAFCGYKTKTKTRRQQRQESEGIILPVMHTLYFIGRIKDQMSRVAAGLNCVAIPISEADDCYSGLVLMRDTRGRGLPIASRIDFVRTSDAERDPEKIGIRPDRQIYAAVRQRIMNRITISAPHGVMDDEEIPIESYESLNFVLRRIFLEYNKNHGKLPFNTWGRSREGNSIFNPFEYENINFNRALRTWSDAEKGAD